jgi:glycogen operon protein
VIYEVHVRGYTRHPSSGVAHPGTYAGLIEKLPYLRDLGVTAIELLPVHEFDETENARKNPLTGEPLMNYWGYSPVAFFAPKAAYAARPARGARAELRDLVQAAHAHDIDVILDVVFNHTAEGPVTGPTFSFRGIDDALYYLHDSATGAYRDVTGCGNTLAAYHPIVCNMIVDCLRSFVTETGVDGFRFDLASALTRDVDGEPLRAHVPLLDAIAADAVLRDVALITEPWDAAGLYQVGSFPGGTRWCEWNGRFRDAARRFVRGEPGVSAEMALRLAGSPDLYAPSGRGPGASINFVTCHDGFTLADAASYDRAHNESNGESNRDGARENHTWNCGVEGPSHDPAILALRARQVRNLLALTFLAHGVPMLLAGDEMGRTQGGNNNAYCHDSPLSWIDWSLAEENADLVRFVRELCAFRRREPLLRPEAYSDAGPESTHRVSYHGLRVDEPEWDAETRWVALHRWSGTRHLYIIANAHWDARSFELPPLARAEWVRVLDTARPSPEDVLEEGKERVVENLLRYDAGARSVVALIARAL